MLDKKQIELIKQINKRLLIVGKFTCSKEPRILNFKDKNSDLSQKNAGKLSREDFFRVVKPEIVSSDDDYKYLGEEVWFHEFKLGRPFDNEDAINTFQIPHDSPLIDSLDSSNSNTIETIQKKGLEIFHDLVKDVDFLANFYHPNFGRALLSYAKEYVFIHTESNPKRQNKSINLNDWINAIEEDPILNKIIIRYLMCYYSDEQKCLFEFKNRLKNGPIFRSKNDNKKTSLSLNNPDQPALMVEALADCKKSLLSNDKIYEEIIRSNEYKDWLNDYNTDQTFGFYVPSIDKDRKVNDSSFKSNYQSFIFTSGRIHRFIRSHVLHSFVFAGLMSKYVSDNRNVGGVQQIVSELMNLSVSGKNVIADNKQQKKYLQKLREHSKIDTSLRNKIKEKLGDNDSIFDAQLAVVQDRLRDSITQERAFTTESLKNILSELFVNLGLFTNGPLLEIHNKNKEHVLKLSTYYTLILSSSATNVDQLKEELENNSSDSFETSFITQLFNEVNISDCQTGEAVRDAVMEKYIELYAKTGSNHFGEEFYNKIEKLSENIKNLKSLYENSLENDIASEGEDDTGSVMQFGAGIWQWNDEEYQKLQADAERSSTLNKRDKNYSEKFNTIQQKNDRTFHATKDFWDSVETIAEKAGLEKKVIDNAKEPNTHKTLITVKVKTDNGTNEKVLDDQIVLKKNSMDIPIKLADEDEDTDNLSFWVNQKKLDLTYENFEPFENNDATPEEKKEALENIWKIIQTDTSDDSSGNENSSNPIIIKAINSDGNESGSLSVYGSKVKISDTLLNDDNYTYSINEYEINDLDLKDKLLGIPLEEQKTEKCLYKELRSLAEVQEDIHKIYNDENHIAKDTVSTYLRSLIFGEYLLSTPQKQSNLDELDTSINMGIILDMFKSIGLLDKQKASKIYKYGIDSEDDDIEKLLRKIKIDNFLPLPVNPTDARAALTDFIQYQYGLAQSLTDIQVYLTELNEIGKLFDAIKNTDLEVIVLDGTLESHSKMVSSDLKKFILCKTPPLFMYLTNQAFNSHQHADLNAYLKTLESISNKPANQFPNFQLPIIVTPFEFRFNDCQVLTNNLDAIPLPTLTNKEPCGIDSLFVDKVIQKEPYLLLCVSLMISNAKLGYIVQPNNDADEQPWVTETVGKRLVDDKIDSPQENETINELFAKAWLRNDYLIDTLILNKLVNIIRLLRVDIAKRGLSSPFKDMLKDFDYNIFKDIQEDLLIDLAKKLLGSWENFEFKFYIHDVEFPNIENLEDPNLNQEVQWTHKIDHNTKRLFHNQLWLNWNSLMRLLT